MNLRLANIAQHPDADPEIVDWIDSFGILPVTAGDRMLNGGYNGAIVDTDDNEVFTSGGCALWAAAAHVLTGWPVSRVSPGANLDCGCDPEENYGRRLADPFDDDSPVIEPGMCICQVQHFLVHAPNGMAWDVRGEHDPAGLAEAYGHYSPTVPASVLIDSLDSWHWNDTAPLAGWAFRSAQIVLSGMVPSNR